MSEERRKILDMLSSGKINVEQAEKLLNAVGEAESDSHRVKKVIFAKSKDDDDDSCDDSENTGAPKCLRILVNSPGKDGRPPEQVNIRIPLGIIKAGMKLGSVIPASAKDKISQKLGEKGIDLDFNNLDSNALGEMIMAMKDMKIVVNDADGEQVRISTE